MIYVNELTNYDYLLGEIKCLDILMPRNNSYWTKVSIKKEEINKMIKSLSTDKKKNEKKINELKSKKRLITDKAVADIKSNIVNYLIEEQNCRCYYCEGEFFKNRTGVGNPTIDHIVDKAKHSEYLFESMNLVLACHTCNGFTKKGEKATLNCSVKLKYTDYTSLDFKIVHPYIDKKNEHLEYCEDQNIWKIINDSEKGFNTIKMFGFDTPYFVLKKYQESASKVTMKNKSKIEDILTYS